MTSRPLAGGIRPIGLATQPRPQSLPCCRHAAALTIALATAWLAQPALAQNDWQYPDPYFGILEIEKSHDASTWRRYRAEVTPPPRHNAAAARPTAAAPPAEQATPVRSTRLRWRNRTRR